MSDERGGQPNGERKGSFPRELGKKYAESAAKEAGKQTVDYAKDNVDLQPMIDDAKAQIDATKEQVQAQIDATKEQVQAQIDDAKEQAQAEIDARKEQAQAEIDARKQQAQAQLDAEKARMQAEIDEAKENFSLAKLFACCA
ncbi:hypothetical protein C8R46DRAFT_1346278 [Mycena filopes]|nr:hypothetical protein C8R46DRAFT_1346278 [Mycena filopes]